MSIGNSTTASVTSLNADIGELASKWHDIAAASQEFFGAINKLGVAGLETIGFSTEDANSFFTAANQMNTASGIWFGQLTQTPAFNFDDATAEARGPQVG